MADNYLENKFEEYKQRKGMHPAPRRTAPKAKPGDFVIKFPSRRVFVTGGASGIGRAIVEQFRKADCQVAFCDINTKQGTLTAQATGAKFYPADVCDAAALDECISRIIEDWGDIDIIVNNAGVFEQKPITETSVEDFDKTIDTNLRAAFVTARRMAIHRKWMETLPEYGRIVNISSIRYIQSEPGTEGYSASKGGISALTHALAASLSEYNITVNAVAPGWICNEGYEKLTEANHRKHPSNRVGKPEDIAKMCFFLCEPGNDFINGQIMVVDGGMTRKMIYTE